MVLGQPTAYYSSLGGFGHRPVAHQDDAFLQGRIRHHDSFGVACGSAGVLQEGDLRPRVKRLVHGEAVAPQLDISGGVHRDVCGPQTSSWAIQEIGGSHRP